MPFFSFFFTRLPLLLLLLLLLRSSLVLDLVGDLVLLFAFQRVLPLLLVLSCCLTF